jgi:hypothetical protein
MSQYLGASPYIYMDNEGFEVLTAVAMKSSVFRDIY